MDPQIRARFQDDMLQQALKRFGDAQLVETLDGFESFVYRVERHGEPLIMRITHSGRRSAGLVQAEVDWINHLAEHGVAAAGAVYANDNELVVAIEDGHGELFLATTFAIAPGVPPWEIDWTPALSHEYGRVMGAMHRLSKGYTPPANHELRFHWDNPVMQDIERNLQHDSPIIFERYQALYNHAQTLPRDRDSYGLVHFDAHEANYHVDDQETITLFDFDDSCYNWFAYDLAIVFFYYITNKPDPIALLDAFLPHFMAGYAAENHLDPVWLEEVPAFLTMREIDLYAVIKHSMTAEEIASSPWCTGFMDGRRQAIIRGEPYVDYDWTSVARWM